MNNIGATAPNNFANPVTPFNPVTRQPVGQENPEARGNVLPPVVEGEETAAAQNRETNREPSANPSNNQEVRNKDQEQQSSQQEREKEQQRSEQEEIQELATRDREVRAHEQAHVNVGGVYAGAPSYTYERGANGINYAVAGEVPLKLPGNTSDPEIALKAAEQIRRAALAPAQPSYQDLRVAARATQMAIQARAELAAQESRERLENVEQTGRQRLELQEGNEARAERIGNLRDKLNEITGNRPEPGSFFSQRV